jgi:signal transduction histidine kinase
MFDLLNRSTDTGRWMKDTSEPTFEGIDQAEIFAEEARMLRARAVGSARAVVMLVLVIAGNLLSLGMYGTAAAWFSAAMVMVAVTVIYAQVIWKDGITLDTAPIFLRYHVVISALTGMVWGSFAISIASQGQEMHTLVAGVFIASITTGGIMAGTIYRPGFLALAAFSLLPFGTYLVLTADGLLQIYGMFVFLYFGFCFSTNKQASQKTREAIADRLAKIAVQSQLDEAEAKRRFQSEKARFLSAISHDLAQPLLTQRNLLAKLEKALDASEHRDLIRQVQNCQDSQEKLLNEMSRANQLGEMLPNVQNAPVDVALMFCQLLHEMRANQSGAVFSSAIDPAVQQILSDPHVIERILRNLLSNAVKYGGAAPHIELRASFAKDRVILTVSDDGPGIGATDQARIFDAHVRLSRDRSLPGSGLGLSICQHLAEQLGGHLELRSEPGQGTQVSLVLPHEENQPAPLPEQSQRFVLYIGSGRSPYYGDWDVLFSEWYWGFAHAQSCTEALTLIEALKLKPDIILIDDLTHCQDAQVQLDQLSLVAPVLGLTARGETPEPNNSPITFIDATDTGTELRNKIEAQLA